MNFSSSHIGATNGQTAGAGKLAPEVIARHWAALHDAAMAIAGIAGVADAVLPEELAPFPATVALLTGWRRVMVEEGLADLVAIMEPGLVAILTVRERGGDARAAAAALWREFVAGREALVALAGGLPACE